ncbi:anti-CBASS protein Acb1 family protein [Variovorax sp. PAMC26660]|uniref:anti-CBASS protein Acb1 family protein n=1 Tax=Variovorax sp. PAMC26660 TaxID=2762322 RepID=UPI00164E01F2|nr:anti-CBASS Acb1 family protein [Variovorax sp. PAMC26660]QNK65892.1 DUF1073 domain-containing protein [Variovorax sp. PAMC26660]
MFNWLFRKPAAAPVAPTRAGGGFFSTHAFDGMGAPIVKMGDVLAGLIRKLPVAKVSGAMDEGEGEGLLKLAAQPTTIPEVLAMWYASQTFIGHQLCAILSQHWLIDKACSMPGRDAIRQGFDVVSIDGDDLDPTALKIMRRYDRAMRLNWNLEQFVRMGRIFGIRVAMFKVDSTDPDYYENGWQWRGGYWRNNIIWGLRVCNRWRWRLRLRSGGADQQHRRRGRHWGRRRCVYPR